MEWRHVMSLIDFTAMPMLESLDLQMNDQKMVEKQQNTEGKIIILTDCLILQALALC